MAYTKEWTESAQFRRTARIDSTIVTLAPTATYFSVRSGQAVPNWREKIRRGVDATSPYSIDAVRLLRSLPIDALASAYSAAGSKLESSFEGFYSAPSDVAHLTVDTAGARNEALGKAYKRLLEAQTHMQGLTTLGEMGEVVRQLRSPFRAIVSVVNSHLNKRGGRYTRAIKQKDPKAADIAAESWLEVSFGLKPLISDAQAAAESLARFNEDLSLEKRRLHASAERVSMSSSKTVEVYSDSHIVGNNVSSRRTVSSVRYVLSASYAAEMLTDVDRFSNLFGLRSDLIIPTAYELVPWSWLVDYFTNVGSVLQSACQSQAAVQYVVRSERIHTLSTYTFSPDSDRTIARLKAFGNGNRPSFRGSPGSIVLERTTFSRAKEPKLALPSLQWRNPFGNYQKDLNMAAVLLARRSSFPKPPGF